MSVNKINHEAKKWAGDAKQALQTKIRNLSAVQTSNLLKKTKYAVRKKMGVADKIQFKFPRYGVFVEKGVGRGWPITRVKGGTSKIKGGRVAKPWFNSTMDEYVPKLADELNIIVTEEALKNIKIK